MDIFISSSIDKNLENSLKFAQEYDLNLEISRFGPMLNLDSEFQDRLDFHKSILKDFKNQLSVHGFFFDLNPSTPDPEVLKITEHRYNQSFTIAKELNAKTVVFHSGYNSLIKHPDYNSDFLNFQVEFWNRFIKRFENEGIIATIENTYEFTPEILIQLVDTINSPNLKLCIDTGHTNINSTIDNVEWIKRLSHRLHHMHLHNNSGNADEHKSVLMGTIDFDKIIQSLIKENIKPNLVLEIFNPDQVVESNKYVREQLLLAKAL